MLGRLRGGTAGAIGLLFATFGAAYGVSHVGCTDYLEAADPIDAGPPVLEDVAAPPLPTREAGGEPARPDSATTLPPAVDAGSDTSTDARDAAPG